MFYFENIVLFATTCWLNTQWYFAHCNICAIFCPHCSQITNILYCLLNSGRVFIWSVLTSMFVVRMGVCNFQIIVCNFKYEVKSSSSESRWMKFWANGLYPDGKWKTVKSYPSVCVCVCLCLQYLLKPEPPVPLFSFNGVLRWLAASTITMFDPRRRWGFCCVTRPASYLADSSELTSCNTAPDGCVWPRRVYFYLALMSQIFLPTCAYAVLLRDVPVIRVYVTFLPTDGRMSNDYTIFCTSNLAIRWPSHIPLSTQFKFITCCPLGIPAPTSNSSCTYRLFLKCDHHLESMIRGNIATHLNIISQPFIEWYRETMLNLSG